MARPPSADPLALLSVRLPGSVIGQLRARAASDDCTLSDAVRKSLSFAAMEPLGKPVPRRRPPAKLSPATSTDPALLRQLGALGNNLNQIARTLNGQVIADQRLDVVQTLATLRSIEQHLERLAGVQTPP